MKQLIKLKLNEVRELSNSEMKQILGGVGAGTYVDCKLADTKTSCSTETNGKQCLNQLVLNTYSIGSCKFEQSQSGQEYTSKCYCESSIV